MNRQEYPNKKIKDLEIEIVSIKNFLIYLSKLNLGLINIPEKNIFTEIQNKFSLEIELLYSKLSNIYSIDASLKKSLFDVLCKIITILTTEKEINQPEIDKKIKNENTQIDTNNEINNNLNNDFKASNNIVDQLNLKDDINYILNELDTIKNNLSNIQSTSIENINSFLNSENFLTLTKNTINELISVNPSEILEKIISGIKKNVENISENKINDIISNKISTIVMASVTDFISSKNFNDDLNIILYNMIMNPQQDNTSHIIAKDSNDERKNEEIRKYPLENNSINNETTQKNYNNILESYLKNILLKELKIQNSPLISLLNEKINKSNLDETKILIEQLEKRLLLKFYDLNDSKIIN